jgi:hypothetical protein
MIYGRRPRQLLVVWATSLVLILLIYWAEVEAPVLDHLVRPFYWIILAVAFFLTWRWLRSRSRKDRRTGDRRRSDRREHADSPDSDHSAQ